MTKYFGKWPRFFSVLLVALLTGLLVSCLTWWQPERMYEHQISSAKGYYILDPNTILESLANRRADVYKKTSGPPEWTYSLDGKIILWNQADYFQIVHAFHEFVWQEPLESWKLHRLSFRIACEDIDRGFLYGDFEYYKIVNIGNEEVRLVRSIHVRPGNNSIDWWERQFSPIREKWKEIDLTKLIVTVDDALALAEQNGGNIARLGVANECDIFLLLKPDALSEGWQVSYSDGGPKSIFDIYIDPFTGEYEVVNP